MKKRHRSAQIVKMLREADAKVAGGRTVEEVCREMGVREATYYQWRKSYGQMKVDQVKRLRDLEKENGRLKDSGVQTLYLAPGSPWENAYIESFNRRFRDELLNAEVFGNLREAQVLVEDYRRRYNHHRPHSSLDYATPAAFAAACLASAPALAGPAPTPNREEFAVNSLIRVGT